MAPETLRHLYDLLSREHERYETIRASGQPMSEEEHDQHFDVIVVLSYLDDERDVPARVLARLLCRLLAGQVDLAKPGDPTP